ncbi:major facilitator transporter [Actinotalea ferrariae CF5-4]|uniref:Major facilitator transporter n=1 Tax=Actinotalea ferrariae CF5-4 TaxID=948458 RepID=A0A021VUU4_9CELL|nr:MFS transporter [Actinotalea ferrariae]EYR64921.1 major facilitator transporter [Actinotalea ferrariae CF5-4]
MTRQADRPGAARRVERTYLLLVLGNTLASSFIWGVNTLFLLDAGLTNLEAFAANAFFTLGVVLFEVPTGVVADTWGRRTSYLLGTVTLAVTTLLYLGLWQVGAPFWQWAVSSVLLGLGFTFFSGALEAWVVDALRHEGWAGDLEGVFGRAQVVMGAAMLTGSVVGGLVAQATSLGVPYLLRVGTLVVMAVVAALLMRDIGFVPDRTRPTAVVVREIARESVRAAGGRPPVRNLMAAGAFTTGVGFYAFYAMQPFLLDLYGRSGAYAVAGLAAAVVAGSQIVGGVLAPRLRAAVRRRTTAIMAGTLVSAVVLAVLGVTTSFPVALALLVVSGLAQAAVAPVRQALLNDLVPSGQRATLLSADSLVGGTGGVVVQPLLGRAADVWGYGGSYVLGAAVQLVAVPLVRRARHGAGDADLRAAVPVPGAPT